MPAAVQALWHLRHLQGWRELFEDIASDKLHRNGMVSCRTHIIFIAGLPKSGSTWIEQLLQQTPGLVQLNKSALREYPHNCTLKLMHSHDIAPEMLSCAPKNKLSFLKLHLNPYPRNFKILDDHNIKSIVLIRDLRDMLISRYHHVISQQTHWDYQRLMGVPKKIKLLESMKGVSPEDSETVIEYYGAWVSGWMERAKLDPENIIVIKYEEMRSNVFSSLKKIYGHYAYKIEEGNIKAIISKQQREHKNDKTRTLKDNLKQRGRAVSTFRKGTTGEWRELFDTQLKEFFKKHAGSALIKSGYERDNDW
tara:strand:- start:530 stop:1453 length:924 start_codon:yes stop_codon:yes gene_type:complete